jgi:hypothetical protein
MDASGRCNIVTGPEFRTMDFWRSFALHRHLVLLPGNRRCTDATNAKNTGLRKNRVWVAARLLLRRRAVATKDQNFAVSRHYHFKMKETPGTRVIRAEDWLKQRVRTGSECGCYICLLVGEIAATSNDAETPIYYDGLRLNHVRGQRFFSPSMRSGTTNVTFFRRLEPPRRDEYERVVSHDVQKLWQEVYAHTRHYFRSVECKNRLFGDTGKWYVEQTSIPLSLGVEDGAARDAQSGVNATDALYCLSLVDLEIQLSRAETEVDLTTMYLDSARTTNIPWLAEEEKREGAGGDDSVTEAIQSLASAIVRRARVRLMRDKAAEWCQDLRARLNAGEVLEKDSDVVSSDATFLGEVHWNTLGQEWDGDLVGHSKATA